VSNKEYRVELRIKNNKLYNLITTNYNSIQAFAKKFNLCPAAVGNIINMKSNLVDRKTGVIKDLPQKLCKIFKVTSEQLYPTQHFLTSLETNLKVFEFDEEELMSLDSDETNPLLSYTPTLNELVPSESANNISYVLSTLNPREERVIRMRFYDKMTLEQIAVVIGIKRERVHQIELRAMRKMRHPARSQFIKEYY
jgi:RNA polymerase sigma factor (sigma-70 family)